MENQYGYIPNFANCIEIRPDNYRAGAVVIFLGVYLVFRRFFGNHHHLPVFTFKPKPGGNNEDPIYCAVCLHSVAGGERYRKLPKCNHCFHVKCIDEWFEVRSTCPLCRTQVHLLPKHRKGGRGTFSYFLSFSQHFLKKMANVVIDRSMG